MVSNDIKSQRDRFLAFSFAVSDLLLEVDKDGNIQFVLGAAMGVTGLDGTKIIGQSWLQLFDEKDHAALKTVLNTAKENSRFGPVPTGIVSAKGKSKAGQLNGFRMGGKDSNVYLTVVLGGITPQEKPAWGIEGNMHQDNERTPQENFADIAMDALSAAKEMGKNLDMTLLDLTESEDFQEKLGPEKWDAFVSTLTDLLQSKAADGKSAMEIAEGKYSILHDKTINAEDIAELVGEFSKNTDPDGEGMNINSTQIDASTGNLSERESARALIYTLNEFEKRGTNAQFEDLTAGFKGFVSANAVKIKELKSIIASQQFRLYFQPVVEIETGKASHYEMLIRFNNGAPTYDTVRFCEDIGMAHDLDLSVCSEALNYINYRYGEQSHKFAINLSGQSIKDKKFVTELRKKLKQHPNLSKRLMFEITESTSIENLDEVNNYIKELQSDGYAVCLDDFGAGSASFQYLQKLHVDYVKIDGAYTKRLLESARDATMVKSLVQMCHDLGIKVVAEMVETEDQLSLLKGLNVQYAQGFYYAKPSQNLDYEQQFAEKQASRKS